MANQARDPKAREEAKDQLKKNEPKKADDGPQRNATPKDVEQAEKDLKSDDPKKRKEAEEKLKDIQEQAKDPKAREAAEQAMAKHDLKPRTNDTTTPEVKKTGRGDDKATDLQLDDFNKIDKDILKDLKMSEKDLEKLKEDLKDLRRREAEKEKLADPKNKGALGNVGGRKVEGTGTATDNRNGARLKPPPGYGEAWRNFNKMPTQPTKDKEKDKE
jgi:hypothetical protein